MTFNATPGDSSDSAHSITSGVFNAAGVQVKGTIGASFVTDVIRVERAGQENAVKILSPAASSDPDLMSRFLTNARYNQSLGDFTGMHITEIVDASTRPYYVMQRVAESSLLEVIRRHAPIDGTWLMNLLLPVARSLDTIHQRNVLHANIKPSNFLVVVENGEEKFLLVDYLEPSLAATSATLTGAGVYAAPEFRAGMPVSNRSDIFSLGAVVYEALSGVVPAGVHRSHSGEFHVWRAGSQATELARLNPEIPKSVSDSVMNAIAPQAISRQASASAFVEESLRALEAPRTRVRVAEPEKESAPVPMLLITIGVFLAIMLLFGGYALVRSVFGGSDSPSTSTTAPVTQSTQPNDGSLTDAEVELIRHLPTESQECRANRNTGTDKKWPIANAIVDCTSAGTSALTYGSFVDEVDLDDTYEAQANNLVNQVASNGGEVKQTEPLKSPCSQSPNESGEWGDELGKGLGGRFTCVSDPTPRIVWTERSTHIIGDASLASGSINELIQWWNLEAGPQ